MSITEYDIIAENIDEATYMRDYAEQHTEWVDGKVLALSPVHEIHNRLTRFISALFDAYLAMTHEGRVFQDTFVMRLNLDGNIRNREPDVFVVTSANLDKLTDTYMDGAADLVVEIVSPESGARDRGTKFEEYEQAGVREYWLIDPHRRESLFYVLGDDGLYHQRPTDSEGMYHSLVLPRLEIDVRLFQGAEIPNTREAIALVDAMLGS